MRKTAVIFKRALCVVISITMLFSLASCNFKRSSRNAAIREAKKYFEYLKDQDIKKLNKLFSDDVKESHDLEDEWDTFFDSIDGNIVSYGKVSSGGEEKWSDLGKVTYYDIVINFEDVTTDTGTVYEYISYRQVRIDSKHPDREGISLFVVRTPSESDDDLEEITVGEIIIYYD